MFYLLLPYLSRLVGIVEKDITDLLGCRYRAVQRRKFPDIPPTEAAKQRAARAEEGRRQAMQLLPQAGTTPGFTRIDALGEEETFDALVAGADLITNAEFVVSDVRVHIDVLVRDADNYIPVVISSHRVARPAKTAKQEVVPTSELGIGQPKHAGWKVRNHAADSFRLALADRALAEYGLSSGKGGAIGQDPSLTFIEAVEPLQHGLTQALETPEPTLPRRIKECKSCRYWFDCERQLVARDDISLLLSGDSGSHYIHQGITTVQQLIDANLGESSQLARAWRKKIPVLRRKNVTMARYDIEIDIDLEAYLDHGAYLWGVSDGQTYIPFVTWEPLGGEAEARNFAMFWDYLKSRLLESKTQGKSIALYCYSNHGENYWMRSSAKRFAGYPGVPSEGEINAFLGSPYWIDVFREVRRQLVGPEGLGLKVVARVAGFYWEGDLDGETSVNAYRQAISENNVAIREQLLRYNRDDCFATAAVRKWLSHGAPGIPILH